MLYKIIGFLLVVIGIFMIRYFPDVAQYQHSGMTLTGIWIAVLMILIGILMIVFL